jgi:predicted DNA-binding antitoxin AbrB/MazE fold protein
MAVILSLSHTMTQTLEAIYENGNFRPLKAPQLAEGQLVQLVIQSPAATSPDDILAIAASVYEGLSEPEIQAIEQIAGDRTNFMQAETTV